MATPRTKRQFAGAASDPAQRQITSFFSASTTANTPSSNNGYINQISQSSSSTTQRPDNSPNIPASVQANLLSVGMRVRKSVPEGYKTGSYSAFALWDESDAEPITVTMGEGQRSRANAFSSPRELLPFCGIHRVGGLGTQPDDQRPLPSMPNIHTTTSTTPLYRPGFGTDMDDMPGLTSSQETVGSDGSDFALPSEIPGARARKRFFVEDEDEISGQLNLWRYNNHDTSLSPRDLAQSSNGRAIAVPRNKGRLRAKLSGGAAVATAMPSAGQENLMAIDNDFEEAAFLDRGTWEVEMNDV